MRKLKAAKHDAAACTCMAMCMGSGQSRLAKLEVFMKQGSTASACSGRRAQIKPAQHGVLSQLSSASSAGPGSRPSLQSWCEYASLNNNTMMPPWGVPKQAPDVRHQGYQGVPKQPS